MYHYRLRFCPGHRPHRHINLQAHVIWQRLATTIDMSSDHASPCPESNDLNFAVGLLLSLARLPSSNGDGAATVGPLHCRLVVVASQKHVVRDPMLENAR